MKCFFKSQAYFCVISEKRLNKIVNHSIRISDVGVNRICLSASISNEFNLIADSGTSYLIPPGFKWVVDFVNPSTIASVFDFESSNRSNQEMNYFQTLRSTITFSNWLATMRIVQVDQNLYTGIPLLGLPVLFIFL
jgi:hypothetical protein